MAVTFAINSSLATSGFAFVLVEFKRSLSTAFALDFETFLLRSSF
jgi:hypothetical protein